MVRSLVIFYADDGLIGFRDPEWIQGDLNVLIGLLHRVGLMSNVTKSNTMTYQPGKMHKGMLEEDFNQRITGIGAIYLYPPWRRIPCTDCGVDLTAGSMTAHHRHLYGTELDTNWDLLPSSQTEQTPHVYELRLPTAMLGGPYQPKLDFG